jgi:Holliday junction resolvase
MNNINSLRRSRGYSFEHKIVQELSIDGWQCRRMGGSSVGLPDTVATFNAHSILLAIEAKASSDKYCYIPVEQLERCNDLLKFFNAYENRRIILAFKFRASVSPLKRDNGFRRKLRYYYFVLPQISEDLSGLYCLRCNYEGYIRCIMKEPDPKREYKCSYNFLEYYSYKVDSLEELKEKLILQTRYER